MLLDLDSIVPCVALSLILICMELSATFISIHVGEVKHQMDGKFLWELFMIKLYCQLGATSMQSSPLFEDPGNLF